ncbi:unnamed protein product [Arctogadus glacialis]
MSNTTATTSALGPPWGSQQLFCPLMVAMREHSLNNNTGANRVVVSVLGLVSCLGILENVPGPAVGGGPSRLGFSAPGPPWELGGASAPPRPSVFFPQHVRSGLLLACHASWTGLSILVVRPVWSHEPTARWRTAWEGSWGYHAFLLVHAVGGDAGEGLARCGQASTGISKMLFAFLAPLVVIAGSYVLFWAPDAGKPFFTRQTSTSFFTRTPAPPVSPSARPKHPKHNLLSQSFTKMVTSVIAAFILCWAPYHIFCLIEVSAHYWPPRVKLVEVGLPFATLFAFLNPVLNPILYAFSCPNFCVRIRHSLGALFEGLVEEDGSRGLGKTTRQRRRSSSVRDINLT